MINKEEIKWARQYLKEIIIDWKNELKGKDYFEYINTPNDLKTIEIVSQYISELEEDNKRLEEINAEHQKLNGELREKIKELEEINKGKTIQELGVSNLYKED